MAQIKDKTTSSALKNVQADKGGYGYRPPAEEQKAPAWFGGSSMGGARPAIDISSDLAAQSQFAQEQANQTQLNYQTQAAGLPGYNPNVYRSNEQRYGEYNPQKDAGGYGYRSPTSLPGAIPISQPPAWPMNFINAQLNRPAVYDLGGRGQYDPNAFSPLATPGNTGQPSDPDPVPTPIPDPQTQKGGYAYPWMLRNFPGHSTAPLPTPPTTMSTTYDGWGNGRRGGGGYGGYGGYGDYGGYSSPAWLPDMGLFQWNYKG